MTIPGFRGVVLSPGDADYDRARRVWNGAVDRRPAMIAQCLDAKDVRRALVYARREGLSIAVRGGGHSLAGHSTCDGLIIDLRRMNQIRVDPRAAIATVGPGCTWGDFDAATRPHGLTTPGGDTSSVGVAGLTLGGGLGWLTRMYGMTSDNLVAAEVITADGERFRTDADTHRELFWALRGGGGNFGIVTELVFRLHAVPPALLAGTVSYPAGAAAQVLARIAQLTPDLPDEISWAAAFNHACGEPTLEIRICYVGAPDDRARAALQPLRTLGAPLADGVRPMSYRELQQMTDSNAPSGVHYASASEWLCRLTDESIAGLVAATIAAPSAMSLALLNPLGGAAARHRPDATAFAYRHAAYAATIIAAWPAGEPAEPHQQWARDLGRTLQRDSAGGGYVNIFGDEGRARIRSAYGERYPRLVAAKDRYDPNNVFCHNHNILPSRLE